MGHASILSFLAAARQLAALFPVKSTAALHAMMGITPMIGINDDGTTFTLHDAQLVANFARDHGVGLLSYWAFQRDRAQAAAGNIPLGAYSGVVQDNHQFHRVFKTAQGPRCTYPEWEAHKAYEVGQVVAFQGRLYGAVQPNPGYVPTVSHFFWSPYACPSTSAESAGNERRYS
jgi:chitinase